LESDVHRTVMVNMLIFRSCSHRKLLLKLNWRFVVTRVDFCYSKLSMHSRCWLDIRKVLWHVVEKPQHSTHPCCCWF